MISSSPSRKRFIALTNHLETHGYVVRVPDPTDRRAKLVQPTERGLEVFAIAQELVPELEDQIRQVIGADRVQALWNDLEAIRRTAAQ